jgi:putative transposase
MAWEEHSVVEIRERFVLRAKSSKVSISAACREFGISRKTGYKWLARYERGGVDALQDQSRRPRLSRSVDGETVLRVLELQAKYRWGPKKLREMLRRERRGPVPSARTVARILQRNNIVRKKRRAAQISSIPSKAPRPTVRAPNDLWTVDFKGWWVAQNGERCEPLTMRDAFSRYVLCARIVESRSTETIQREFTLIFRQFGIPKTMLFDNGDPFASTQARAGLTRLSAWLVSLGITILRSRPGKPQDNGSHERMHLDILEEVQAHPAPTRRAQQRVLSLWRARFNDERPHEALRMRTPSEVYFPSTRAYVGPQPPRYAEGWRVRRVNPKGFIKLEGEPIFLGEGLVGHHIALQPGPECVAWFYGVTLGMLKPPASVPPSPTGGT